MSNELNPLSQISLGDFHPSPLGKEIRTLAIAASDALADPLNGDDQQAVFNRISGMRSLQESVQYVVLHNHLQHAEILELHRHVLDAIWQALHCRDVMLATYVEWDTVDRREHKNPLAMSEHFRSFLNNNSRT